MTKDEALATKAQLNEALVALEAAQTAIGEQATMPGKLIETLVDQALALAFRARHFCNRVISSGSTPSGDP